MTRVVVVDPSETVRVGLRVQLRHDDVDVVGDAADERSATLQVTVCEPDVVVLDPASSGWDVADAVAALRRIRPGVALLVFTDEGGAAAARQALRSGASGYLLKTAGREELVDAVLRAGTDDIPPAAEVATALAREVIEPPVAALSWRERQIVSRLAEGMTNRQISRLASISEGTVKTYLKRIYAKLGVNCRTAAVRIAMERGLTTDVPAEPDRAPSTAAVQAP